MLSVNLVGKVRGTSCRCEAGMLFLAAGTEVAVKEDTKGGGRSLFQWDFTYCMCSCMAFPIFLQMCEAVSGLDVKEHCTMYEIVHHNSRLM